MSKAQEVIALWVVVAIVFAVIGITTIVKTGTIEAGATVRTWIEQTQLTARVQAEWNGRVEIARIWADAHKKTDASFILFYLSRFMLWAGGILSGVAILLWLVQRKESA